MGEYFSDLRSTHGSEVLVLELGLADDGPGIASALSRDFRTEHLSWTDEAAHFIRAFADGPTSLGGDPDAGKGLGTMLRTCASMQCRFLVASGRCEFSRDFLASPLRPNEDPTRIAPVRERALLGGTTYSIFVPLADAKLF
jgi:hypothetical protein